jgi:hypothetical protein
MGIYNRCFGAPLEELNKKYGVGPQLQFGKKFVEQS